MNKTLSCSEQTKMKMAEALKELIATEPFEKITIADITKKCGVHRQTFYYHFQDMYKLLGWTLQKELLLPLSEGFSLENVYDKLLWMLSTMYNDKEFYQQALKINREVINRFVGSTVTNEVLTIIRTLSKESSMDFEDEEEMFISEFFGCGISGAIFNWISRGMKDPPEIMIKKVERLVEALRTVIDVSDSNT